MFVSLPRPTCDKQGGDFSLNKPLVFLYHSLELCSHTVTLDPFVKLYFLFKFKYVSSYFFLSHLSNTFLSASPRSIRL